MVKKQKGILLSRAIEGFLIACQARRLSPNTIDDYTRTLRKFVAHAGDMQVDNIGTSQIAAFLSVQKVGKKTVLNYHIGLAAFWTWMLNEKMVERHIVRLVEKPRPDKFVVEPFTEVQIRALLATVNHDPERNRALILLLIDTGARASEICNLKKTDIDLVNHKMKVLGKGGKERMLPFSQRTASALTNHFMSMEGTRPFPMTRTSLSQYLRRLGKRAGVLDCHPHRFRHTMAVTWLRNGGDPYTLQEILGHSTMDMVRRYINLAQVDLENAHRKASPVENWKL
jgi:site-specific recombinase XerD